MKPYYEENGITIYHGDCREVLPSLGAGSVDLVLTDPPYGVGINYGDTFTDELDYVRELLFEVIPMCRIASRGAVVLTAGKYETELALYQRMPPKWRLCWHKGSTSNISPIGFNDWEAVLVYGDKYHNHAHDYFYAQPEKMGAYGHPCPKPIKYYSWIASRFSKPGQTILDPFMGSGTALRSAMDLGRKAIGIDVSERYCQIAAERLRQSVLQFEGVA
jgi:site-specific DNA-methyltransferase (adenine-specific)